jgi:hypothetical protein
MSDIVGRNCCTAGRPYVPSAGGADWGRIANDTYVTFASAHPLESIAILAEHECYLRTLP